MKNEKMKHSARRVLSKFGGVLRVYVAVMLLCGLSLWLSSCEREIPDQGTGIHNVGLKFVLGNGSYDEGGSSTRGYGGLIFEPEMVVVPLGSNLYLYADLEAASSDPLRDSEDMNNTLVMIVAYKSDSSEVSHAEYRVASSGNLLPTDPSGRGLEVYDTGNYTFVAYSIHSTVSVPAYPSAFPHSISVSPDDDLLWGSVSEKISAGSNTVSIPMKHKFSQVKVSVTAASNITALTGVSMSPVYASATMQVSDGALSNPKNPVSQLFSFSSLGSKTITSANSSLVYTAGQAFSISIGSIATESSGSASSVSAAFNNTVLLPGKKYTLQLNFGIIQFALSNIYWKDPAAEPDLGTGYLTFDRYVSDQTTPEAIEKMHKQGVFFKSGSLVGISPGRTNGLDNFDANATSIYIPAYNADDKSQNWSSTTATANGKNWIWSTIPHHTGTYTGTGDRYDNTIIAGSYNTVANWQSYKGDICQFIDKNYRLPYSWEFGGNAFGTFGNWGSTSTPSPPADGSVMDGTDIRFRCAYHKATNYYFPVSGYRSGSVGALSSSNSDCRYLSGSIDNAGNICNLRIMGYLMVYTTDPVEKDAGGVVRCVRK